ncbi:S-4TM family putative pore-forming effector [Vitiosangium sp. GDMCC 1.1324]|uniref:S-4TM family putative pore-forming effector n=1 Tax=Vitiosangium sp. (strain GDMCC 1.1324) TaxID=2138576 RepID=UPI0011B7B397|nr:S-4TM family putative pore-forming effector [Vitiosangium sp. GDMCC 1.1324]
MSAPNDIGVRQDLEENLERLAALRALYSRAKSVRGASALVATLLAVASPLVTLYWPKGSAGLALGALVWALVELVLLDGLEEKNRQEAALIQEEFDTRVFGLPWNEALGARPAPELVVAAGKAGKGDPKLKGWYADVSRLPRSLAILLCQRSGLAWDHRSRAWYQTFLAAVALLLALGAVALAMGTRQSLTEFLVNFALPVLPAVQHAIKTFKAHRRAGAEQERLRDELASAWEGGLASGGNLHEAQLRRVQDRLLLLRREQTPIPDVLYRLLRPASEATMHEATRRLIDDAVRQLGR